jgi:hypothetical protein
MKRIIGYSHYVDKLVYATVDGGRRKIMKLKPRKKKFYTSLECYRAIQKMFEG